MSTPVNASINILVNTSQATAQLRSLQAQIAATNKGINSGSGAAAAQQAALSKALMDSANASRMWNARVVPVTTATQQFSDALDRGKMSLGQYTRYASSQLPGMSRIFKREFDMMSRVAEQNVKRMQTQYVALGNNAAGAAQAMAMTPTALNKQAAATQIAAQRQMMMNRMIDLGSTKLLNWGKNTQWAGRQLMVGFSLPLAMMGAAAAKAFKEIDKAEISFKRVYGNLETTTAEMERNLDAVKELGAEYTKYGKSMASTIDIAARVAATGAQGDALVAGTEQTIRLATLGLMEYDEALDATIALQTAFQTSNEDLAPTIDFLNIVENETILTMQDMAAAIPRVAPVIKGLGGDVKDLAVMMTALREGGVTAEQGANAIKSGLGRLINPTKAAREEMAKYNISIDAIAQQNKGDLMGMLNDFSDALVRLGNFEQQQVLQKVFGTYQYARLGALFKNLANDSGQAARAIELTSMSVEDLARVSDKELSKIEEATSVKFQAAIEKMKIAIAPVGETFLKILTPVIDIVTKIADKFNNLPDGIKNAITVAIALIAGIGPIVLMVVGLFANGIANIVKFVQIMRKFFARLKGDSSAFGHLAQKEQEARLAADGLSGSTEKLTGKFVIQQRALERLIELLSIYSGRLGSVAGIALPATAPGKTGFVPAAKATSTQPRSFFTPMGRMIPPRKYAGGVTGVPGTGNKDTVPALLTPGESVVTKSATQKYAPVIAAMNAGTLPGFNGGLTPSTTQLRTTDWAARYAGIIPGRSIGPIAARLSGAENELNEAKALGKGVEEARKKLRRLQQALRGLIAQGISPTAAALDKSVARMKKREKELSKPPVIRRSASREVSPQARALGYDRPMQQLQMTGDEARQRGHLGGAVRMPIERAVRMIEANPSIYRESAKEAIRNLQASGAKYVNVFNNGIASISQTLNAAMNNNKATIDMAKKELGNPKNHVMLREQLKNLGMSDDEIEKKLIQYTARLNAELDAVAKQIGGSNIPLKRKDMDMALRRAAGIAAKETLSSSKDYSGGRYIGPGMGTESERTANARMMQTRGISVPKGGDRYDRLPLYASNQGKPFYTQMPQMEKYFPTQARQFPTDDLAKAGVPRKELLGAFGSLAKTPAGIGLQRQILATQGDVEKALPLFQKGGQLLGYTFARSMNNAAGLESKKLIPTVGAQSGHASPAPAMGKYGLQDGTLYAQKWIEAAQKYIGSSKIATSPVKGQPVGKEDLSGVRMSTKVLASTLIATLGDAKTSLLAAFRQIPAFAWEATRAIAPIFVALGQAFIQLNPWITKSVDSIKRFLTQISYTWMGLKLTGAEAIKTTLAKAKAAYVEVMLKTMIIWEKAKTLPMKAKNAYETAMIKTMLAWESVKRMPAQIKNAVSTFMSDLPRNLQRLRNQVFYRGQDVSRRVSERLRPVRERLAGIRDSFKRAGTIAANPVPRAMTVTIAGMVAQEKLNSAVTKASQAFDPIKSKIVQFGQSISSAAQFVSKGFQLLADPLGRAVVVATITRVSLEKLNAALEFVRQKLSPIATAFNSVVSAVKGVATKISRITQLLMDPLGRAVVISTLSKRMQEAFSSAVTAVKAGANKLYESLLWGAIKAVTGIEKATIAIRGVIVNVFNGAVTAVKAGATKLYESMILGAIKVVTGVEKIVGAFAAMRTMAVTKWNNVLATLRSVNLKQAFIDAGKAIKGAATGGADEIKKSLRSAAISIRDAGRIAGAIISNVGAAGKGVAQGIGGWLGKVNEKTGQTRGQRISGVGNSAVMGLMGVSMAASFLEGELGEMAQKIMPVTMGLMGLQMLLPMLTNPFGLAIVAVGALTAMFVKTRMDLDNLARSAAEAGANLGGIANRQQEMSAATGYTFASQRAKDRLFRINPDQKESMSQFSEYFESERGTKFLDNLRELTSAERYTEVAKMISMAIADGMDEETAKAYGYSVAYYLNDAVMQEKLKLDFAAGNFAKGIDNLIDIIAERQAAIDALGGYRPTDVGQSGASRSLANMTGIGKYDTQKSMFAEGLGKTGAAAGVGTLAGLGVGLGATMAMYGVGLGAALSAGVAGATAGSVVPIVGTVIGAITGTLIGGLVAWKQYQDQVARLNENIGSAARIMGGSIQVLGELRGAEQLLIEKRQEGLISAEEYATEMARVDQIEAKATANMSSVIQSMMMGGQVDTGALNEALKSQLIVSGFEGDLAGAVVGTINVENIAKALFPEEDLDTILADQAKRSAITAVMIESLAGITPENAKQRVSDVTSQWSSISEELLIAAEDGLTQDEARAVLAGKRAGQIVMDRLLGGAEGSIEGYSAGTTASDYEKAADALSRIAAGNTTNLPSGVKIVEGKEGDPDRVEVNGRVYEASAAGEEKKSLAVRVAEGQLGTAIPEDGATPAQSSTLNFAQNDLDIISRSYGYNEDAINFIANSAKQMGVTVQEFLADAMADPTYGPAFVENMEAALKDENFDWMQLEGLGIGTTAEQIKESIMLALDLSDVKIKYPELEVTDVGTTEQYISGAATAWAALPETQTAIEERAISPEQLDVGLAAATDVLGAEGLNELLATPDAMNVLLDLIAKMNTAEFAGMDMAKAIEEVFGGNTTQNAEELTDGLNKFEDSYSGMGPAFGENAQIVIDYFKGMAEESKNAGETSEDYVKRMSQEAKGYAEIIKGMPTDMTARLGINIEDPSTFMEIGPHLDQVIKMWPILSNLDKGIDLKAAIEAGLLTTENGEYKSPDQLAKDVKTTNKTWKNFGKAETLEAKKKILFEMTVNENDPEAVKKADETWNSLIDRFGEAKVLDMGTDVFKKAWDLQITLTGNADKLKDLKDTYASLAVRPGWAATEAGKTMAADIKALEIAIAQGESEMANIKINPSGGSDTGSSGSSGGGGGGKESPLKGFKEEILNMAKLWTDATMSMEKLNNAKMSFAQQVFKGQGIFDKLKNIKGLPKDAISQIMEMGPEGSEEFIKKFTKGNKITAAGKGFLQAQSAARINQMVGEDRLSNIDTRKRTRAARSLMGEQGVSRETFNFIAEDTDRLDAYWELKKRANKGDKEAVKDLERFLKIQQRKVNLEEKFNDSLKTGIELAREEWDEYASKQNAFFDREFAAIQVQEDIQFEADYGMSVSDMEWQIKLNEDLIDGYRERIQVINDEIRALETRNGIASDYSDWGIEQLQKEIDSNQDLIRGYERQNELAQRKIDNLKREDELRMRVSEELSRDLEIMSEAETKIDEAYNKRIEALDKVQSINQQIIEQQKQQLNLSQAISEGDIYAATAAAQEMRASAASFAVEQVRTSLDKGRENEIASLRTSGGLTREQAEKQISDIKEQSYQTSLKTRLLEDEIYNRQINDILPLKDKEFNLNKALESLQDSIATKQLAIRDIERSKIEPLERQNALMAEQVDDHLLKIEGKQRDVKNEVGLTKDEFEKMNNWMQADLAWQELMTKETERAEQKAADLAAQWQNVGEQIQAAKKALAGDFAKIALKPLGKTYTEEDRKAERAAAQARYDKAVSGYLSSAASQTSAALTTDGSSGETQGSSGKTPSQNSRSIMMPGMKMLTGQALDEGIIYMDKNGRFRWTKTKKLVPTMPEGDLSKYFSGGMVAGNGSRDSIRAILSPGEFIIRKAMVDKYGTPLMNALNQGSFAMPTYNTGPETPQMNSVNSTSISSTNAPVYNTYDMKFSINGASQSADDIANKVMFKMKQLQNQQVRGNRGY
jgi:TP901 family phage tail tape measure protein